MVRVGGVVGVVRVGLSRNGSAKNKPSQTTT